MADLLRHSLLWRLWQWLKDLCRRSLTGRLLGKLWHSRFANGCRRLLEKAPAAERSVPARAMRRLNRGLWRLGQRLEPVKERSLVVRAWRALKRGLRHSLILRRICAGGVITLVLTALGLFGIIDWLLRDAFSVPVLSSYWDELLLILGLLLVLHQRLASPQPLRDRTNVLDLPVLQFLVVCLTLFFLTASVPRSIDLSGLRATAQSILWFFVLTRLLRDAADVRRIYLCMVLAAFLISLHGIWQYIVRVPIPPNWTDQAELSVRTRVYSIFGSPNILGDFLLLFTPMTLALAYWYKTPWRKLLSIGMALCMLAACLFTMSRGAWIGMLVSVLVFSLLVDLRLLALIGFGGVFSLAIPFVSNRVLYLFSNAFAESTARGGRQVRWEKALGYLKLYADPDYGMGFGRFGGAVAMQNQVDPRLQYFYVDNYYIKILVENGHIGLASYLLMMLGVLWAGFRSWFACRRSKRRPLVSGMFAGLCGVLVHCYFENIFEEPYMLVYFWTIAAMMVFLGMRERDGADAAGR